MNSIHGGLIEPHFAVPAAACEPAAAREASPRLIAHLSDLTIARRALAAFALRACRKVVPHAAGGSERKGRPPCGRKRT